jgi:hypothetical protein
VGQEDFKFKTILGSIARSCFKTKTKQNKTNPKTIIKFKPNLFPAGGSKLKAAPPQRMEELGERQSANVTHHT